MADKSPRHGASKKRSKSIKDKRREKKAKAAGVNEMERLVAQGHRRSH